MILLKVCEGYIIVKYMSILILVIICKIFAELWPFLDLVFVVVLILVCLNNFCRDVLNLLKFAEIYIIVKYSSGLILIIVSKILAKWPFFVLVFVFGVKY